MLRRWRRSPPSSMSLLKGQIAPARNGMEECRVEGVLSAACCTALRSANPSRHWGGSTNDGRSSHPCFAVHAVLLPVESANLSSSARMSCSSSWFSFGLKAGVACVTCCVDLLRVRVRVQCLVMSEVCLFSNSSRAKTFVLEGLQSTSTQVCCGVPPGRGFKQGFGIMMMINPGVCSRKALVKTALKSAAKLPGRRSNLKGCSSSQSDFKQ